MQINNTNPPIRLTGRHITVTAAMEEYVRRRLATLHLDYPRILEIHVILGLEKYRHRVDIVLRCNWHITIKTTAETEDMYASIDRAIDRTARQMRKYHTRLMSEALPRRKSVRRAVFCPNQKSGRVSLNHDLSGADGTIQSNRWQLAVTPRSAPRLRG